MRTGKVPETVLRRSVLGRIHAEGSLRYREFYGEDCAFLSLQEAVPGSGEDAQQDAKDRQGTAGAARGREETGAEGPAPFLKTEKMAAYTSVCAVPGFERHPGKLVLAAANNLCAGGAHPAALMLQAVIPDWYEESSLQRDMDEIAAQAGELGMRILGGHTQVSDAVKEAVYTVTGIGTAKTVYAAVRMENPDRRSKAQENREASGNRAGTASDGCEESVTEGAFCGSRRPLLPGDELVLTKWIALGGTAALALNYEEKLKSRYPYALIDRAKEFEKLMAVVKDARAVNHFGRAAVHDLSQGGIFGALREMAEHAGVGLEVDLRKIPVKQETIEICEYFDVNPYELYSAGALLVGTEHGEALVRHLARYRVPAAVIGRVTAGRDRIIQNGEDRRCLDRVPQDAWYRRKEPQG